MSFDDIPPELAGLSQFCLRKEKKPWIRDTANGGFTPKWTDQAGWMKLDEALDELERNKSRFDGVGYLNTKALDDSRQITGGDLDACRDPITGWVSPWALELLEQTKPFYGEISPSGCGLRFFYLARLPNRVDSLFGNGPQELPDDVKEHIIAAKPTIKEKIDKGEPVFNSIELYENKRHLTLTGNTLKDFCHPIEDKTEALAYALALAGIVTPEKPKATLQAAEIEQIRQNLKRRGLTDEQINAFLESKGMNPARAEGCQGAGAGCYEMPGWVNDMSKEANKNRLPHIDILDVIDTRGWEICGPQLRGPHPTLGSTTGHNLIVKPCENIWCYMHNGLNRGGDSWDWLACECGAVKWEEAGAGALKDPAIKVKTVAYAKSKKLIPEDALPHKLTIEDVCDIEIDEKTGEVRKITLAPTKASKAIIAHFTLAMEKGDDQIYYYNPDGIYDPDGVRKIDLALTSVAGDANNNFKLREVLRRVRNQLLEGPVTFDPDPYLLGVSNGLVDLRTGEFRQYRPEDLITDRIDVAYDPEVKCPKFMEFLESITPDPIDRLMLVDWFAITAIKEPFAYVLFLLGLGRNGKGIYEKMLKKFFGRSAFRDMPLAAIDNSDFAASEFYKKRGWIASESGKNKKKASIGTDFIKLTSGNGVIDANVKGKNRIQFEPFFQTLVDTNTMPPINDNSTGWKERFCKANMPYVFVSEPDPNNPLERLRDPHLFEKLSTPSELSGILNLIIYRAKEIALTKTITKRSGEAMFEEYAEQSASVGTFLELFCEYVTTGIDFWTPVTPIYDAYKEWCSLKVGEVVDSRYFGKLLTDFCGGETSKVGKDKDRKSVRLYKRLNFDQKRYEEKTEALRLGVSTYVYNSLHSSLHNTPSTDSDVHNVYIETWNSLYKRFGDNSKNPISKNPICGGICENHVENVDNVDINIKRPLDLSPSTPIDEDTIVDSPVVVGGDGLTPEQIALLERIKGRLEAMNSEVTPFALAIAMKGNDQDIGMDRCRTWLEAKA